MSEPAIQALRPEPSSVALATSPSAPVSIDEDRERKRERKRVEDAHRQLDGWERYRALIDANDEAYELIDIGNREARFALMLMGALNAGAFVLLTRSDAIGSLAPHERQWIAGLFGGYILMALVLLLQAIEALRPGRIRPSLAGWPEAAEDRPARIRYYEDVIQRTSAQHWEAWQEVRLSQLNAELAIQVHSLSIKNNLKHAALKRLYFGLRAMALVLTGLILLFGWLVWT